VKNLLLRVLDLIGDRIDYVSVMRLLLALPIDPPVDQRTVARAVLAHPELRYEIPVLQDLSVYGDYAGLIRKASQANQDPGDTPDAVRNPSDATVSAIVHLLGSNPRGIDL